MPLIRRCGVPFALKYMAKVTTTVRAHDLGSNHAEGAVLVTRHCTGDTVEVCRPSAPRLEFVTGFIQRDIASGASVQAFTGVVLVKRAGSRRLSTFFPENTELFYSLMSITAIWNAIVA